MSDTSDAEIAAPEGATDPLSLVRERSYVVLLVLGALIGVPIAAVAYGFLALVGETQDWLYHDLPGLIGLDETPLWWPVPLLVLAGVVVAVAIDRLPGNGGHEPSAGLASTGAPPAAELPGIVLAAFASLALGAVVGPEAPLILIGGGVAVLIVRLLKKDAPEQALVVLGAAGAFAAVSTLLGSPIVGAFLLMEVAGIAGPMIGVVFVPGLLAAGMGTLVFLGLGNLTGLGTFSLAIPDIPPFEQPEAIEFVWAIVIGALSAVVGSGIKLAGVRVASTVAPRRLALTPLVGLGVALAAVAFEALTDRGTDQVLFSGEDALAPLIQDASSWTVGALVALIVCKSVAYALSLGVFRGGPTFPAMFIGAAGGLALSHVGGLSPIAGVAMGIGGMAVTMLGLPLTSVLLTALFLQADELALMPLIIVSVVVAYVVSARVAPRLAAGSETEGVTPAATSPS